MGELIEVQKYNKTSLKLIFKSGEIRIFNINSIFTSDLLSESMIKRWKIMFENGRFFDVEIVFGDLVWPGWCELFAEDFDKFTYRLNGGI